MEGLTPKEIVHELDKYIVAQNKAKKSVAIALRNRYRRKKLAADIKDEVIPKNILMIGPTGVGKTEIARRLASLDDAPFIKVEVSKFTEVGYMGRDVESMVRDLVETAIRMIKKSRMEKVKDQAKDHAEERLLDILLPQTRDKSQNPLQGILSNFSESENNKADIEEEKAEKEERAKKTREKLRDKLRSGELDNRTVEIKVEDKSSQMVDVFSGAGVEQMGINMKDIFGNMFSGQKKQRKVSVKEAKEILAEEEAKKLIDMEEVKSEATEKVEESGIIFLDEIDKIAGGESSSNPDVSREGVQRDILPIVEGSTIMTKYGSVQTDHILFIAAGAFHVSNPSDLIPELQGRFPIRVELDSLSEDNFKEILTEPENALTKQYTELLKTEDVEIEFKEEGIEELANFAFTVNEETENIGARRLHTIMEKLLEDVSFAAPELSGQKIIITRDYVKEKLAGVVEDKDLSRYIL